MRQPSRRLLICAACVSVALTTAFFAHAASKDKNVGDRIWASPDLASYPLKSIAMLPATSFDGNLQNRRLVEQAIGQSLRTSGHRWVSATTVHDMLMRSGSDSLGQAINDKLLKQKEPRIDSLDAPLVSRTLRARGLFTVRIDQMERRELEPGQSGRPTTSVLLRAALVDSTGRLLWTANSTRNVEGALQEASANVIGVKASGLNNASVDGTSAAPPYQEVLLELFTRWAEQFPRRATADSAATAK